MIDKAKLKEKIVRRQAEKYVARTKKTAGKSGNKKWSYPQFGKRTQQWNRMTSK